MRSLVVAAFAAFALTGCQTLDAFNASALSYSAGELQTQKVNVEHLNDLTATGISAAMCTIPIGELVRNGTGNPNFPSAVLQYAALHFFNPPAPPAA